jgi:hypothetical protein
MRSSKMQRPRLTATFTDLRRREVLKLPTLLFYGIRTLQQAPFAKPTNIKPGPVLKVDFAQNNSSPEGKRRFRSYASTFRTRGRAASVGSAPSTPWVACARRSSLWSMPIGSGQNSTAFSGCLQSIVPGWHRYWLRSGQLSQAKQA